VRCRLNLRKEIINNIDASYLCKSARKAVCLIVAACKRATYDMFGEEGLKNGIPVGTDDSPSWTSGYIFHGDANRVFRDFFGGDNPFQGPLALAVKAY